MLSLLLFGMLSCSVLTDMPTTEQGEVDSSPQMEENWEPSFLSLVNELRRTGCRCGSETMPPVSPLALDERLIKAAQIHADDMYENRFFSHKGSDGSRVGDRVKRAGFDWWNVGENISAGYPTPQSTFEGWKSSPGHCRNMMSGSFKKMGIARRGEKWVQTFGNPRAGN